MRVQIDIKKFEQFERREANAIVFIGNKRAFIKELNRLTEKVEPRCVAMHIIQRLVSQLTVSDFAGSKRVPFVECQAKLIARAELREEQRLAAEKAAKKLHDKQLREAMKAEKKRIAEERKMFKSFMTRCEKSGLSEYM